MRVHKSIARWIQSLSAAFLATVWSCGIPALEPDEGDAAKDQTIPVHCNRQDALSSAVERARPGTTLHVYGFCEGRVVIERGPLTIWGMYGAIIDGSSLEPSGDEYDALVTIRGASGVTLRNLTIQNFEKVGILAEDGAAVDLDGIILKGHQRNIVLSSARAKLSRIHIEDGVTGLQATAGSSVIVTGDVEVEGTGNEAFSLIGAFGELRGGLLNIHHNFGLNLTVAANSALVLPGIPQTANTHVLISNNQGPGILLANGTLEIGGTEPESPTIEVVGNNSPGIVLTSSARLASVVGWANVISSGNPVGMVTEAGSTVWMQGGLNLSENLGPGLVASDTTLVLAPGINPVTIENNAGPDVILEFGSRSTLEAGVVVGSPLICDPTVLSRGDVTCP